MSGTTPNLGIAEIPDNSNQPNAVANTALEWLDTALTDEISVSVAGGVDVTASTPAVLKTASIKLTGVLTASISYKLPANKKWYRIYNTTTGGSYTVTVKVSGGTGVVLQQGQKRLVYCNGTDIFTLENVYTAITDKDVANGIAGLDSNTKLHFSEFPDPRETVNVYDTTASPPTTEISVATQVAILNDAAAGNYSIAPPVAGTDDGKRVEIISIHAQAHVVSVDLLSPPHTPFNATFSNLNFAGSVIGENIVLRAYNGNWYVVGTPVGVTLS